MTSLFLQHVHFIILLNVVLEYRHKIGIVDLSGSIVKKRLGCKISHGDHVILV